MKVHLPAQYYVALESRSPLTIGDLHQAVKEMAVKFNLVHGLVIPALNTPLIMFKHVKELALPRQ
jgi:hypothetical protein